jgi:2-polyprenyl-3-methyl-5-hydroxy-6-metoxy-1,4-benzoquinol methylase
MFLGKEQIHHPGYSTIEKVYIALFGMPVVGLRIRARNVFSLIPKGGQYKRILDAGSGPGVFSFELGRRFPKAKIVGVDLKKESIEASTHISEKIRVFNVEFHQTSILALEEEDSYDLIIHIGTYSRRFKGSERIV